MIFDKPARGQVPDRIEDNLRWIDDAILRKLKEQENWPKGTEVIIYCHDCDLEKVTTEIERKGYKVVHHVSCDQDRILAYAIQKGQYVMAQKVPAKWDKLPAYKSLFTLPNDYHVPIGNIIVQNEFDRQLRCSAKIYLKKIFTSAGQYYDDLIIKIDKSKNKEV